MPNYSNWEGNQLLRLARRAYERLPSNPDECHTVIILAAIALEALMNELEDLATFIGHLASSPKPTTLSAVLARAESERVSTAMKVDLAFLIFLGEVPDHSKQPFQDLDLLLKLRNMLIHSRPEIRSYGEIPSGMTLPKIVRSVASRGLIAMPPEGSPLGWRQYVLVPSVAAWAFDTVLRIIKSLAQCCPDEAVQLVLRARADEFTDVQAPEPAA